MSDSYNREILSRYGQHKKLVDKQKKAYYKAPFFFTCFLFPNFFPREES